MYVKTTNRSRRAEARAKVRYLHINNGLPLSIGATKRKEIAWNTKQAKKAARRAAKKAA
jgi:hypothetical protein